MRYLNRNKQKCYYANLMGTVETKVRDEYGNEISTGEYEVEYSDPIEIHVNIAAPNGAVSLQMFGALEGYDSTIVCPPMDIDETSVFWIDADPKTEPYNHVVVRIASSVNGMLIAIKKINVGGVAR